MEVNGLLEFYTLYQSALGEEAAVVYNSSELFEDYTARNLVPGTTYLFQIAVRSYTPVSKHTHLHIRKGGALTLLPSASIISARKYQCCFSLASVLL